MSDNHKTVKTVRRSDLARLTGCNLETIRYYENIGVMPEPPRNAKNYRCYDESHIARLSFVMRARDLGFTLEEVRDLLALVDGGMQTCAEVQALASRHLESIGAKIADLRRIQMVLSETVAQCSGEDVPDCAVIDALTQSDCKLHTA
ncbi:MerR family transcriptional regulator [Parasedimentitalea psychrophila]|uniref:Helix-turn-helix domain-containing protein n=1 Tax=Parasedimentitalea psychrophila TaxID=2997337 RepID=A0A9Y2P4V4_9RHOB|nr:helix-turn-helix domain-containing protein [Parasedimentitalea psychrophila]WIY25724.1 helix-turn-helix domain-containing protein [Parasedimentitalea psychrophila]